MHRGEICPHGNLESDHPACKNVLTAWPRIQRHYNPSKWCKLLVQQHSLTILRTGIYSIQDSCWPRTLRSHVGDVMVCSLTGVDV